MVACDRCKVWQGWWVLSRFRCNFLCKCDWNAKIVFIKISQSTILIIAAFTLILTLHFKCLHRFDLWLIHHWWHNNSILIDLSLWFTIILIFVFVKILFLLMMDLLEWFSWLWIVVLLDLEIIYLVLYLIFFCWLNNVVDNLRHLVDF